MVIRQKIEIYGLRTTQGRFEEMMAIKLACEKAKVDYPQQVIAYFGVYIEESAETCRIKMQRIDLCAHHFVKVTSADGADIYEVSLAELHDDICAIRFQTLY